MAEPRIKSRQEIDEERRIELEALAEDAARGRGAREKYEKEKAEKANIAPTSSAPKRDPVSERAAAAKVDVPDKGSLVKWYLRSLFDAVAPTSSAPKKNTVSERAAAAKVDVPDKDSLVKWYLRSPFDAVAPYTEGQEIPQGHTWVRRTFSLKEPGFYRDSENDGPDNPLATKERGFDQAMSKTIEEVQAPKIAQGRFDKKEQADATYQTGMLAVQNRQLNLAEAAAKDAKKAREYAQQYQEGRDAIADDIRNKRLDVENGINQLAKLREELTGQIQRDANRLQAAMLGVTQRGQDVQAATSRRGQDLDYGSAAMGNATKLAQDIMSRDVSPAELRNFSKLIAAMGKPGAYKNFDFQPEEVTPYQPRYQPGDAAGWGAEGIKVAQANASSAIPGQVAIPGESANVGRVYDKIEAFDMPSLAGSPHSTPAAGSRPPPVGVTIPEPP